MKKDELRKLEAQLSQYKQFKSHTMTMDSGQVRRLVEEIRRLQGLLREADKLKMVDTTTGKGSKRG